MSTSSNDGVVTMLLLESMQEWFELGGPVVSILLVMSIVAMAVTLLKVYQFTRLGTTVPDPVHRSADAFCSRRLSDAERMLDGQRGLAAEIAKSTINAQRDPIFDPAAARENVTRLAADHLALLQQHFRTLEVIASLAPLLGLFGTVLGMIEAFRKLETAGAKVDPSLLSGGIWEALLTTAVGLAVAIPTVAALNLLEQRVDNFAHQLDSLISRLFTSHAIVSNPANADRAQPSTSHPTDRADLQPAPLPGV